MASLASDDAGMLDEDPIEERLQDLGIEGEDVRRDFNRSMIGWYTGDWHSSVDSKEGARRAKPYSDALRAVGIVGVLHNAEVRGIAVGVEFDWRGEPRKPSGDKAYMTGRIDLGGTPGDPARPWARKDGWDVVVTGEVENGDNVRVTGVQGSDRPTDQPTLLGQLLTEEKRGVPPPDFRTTRRHVLSDRTGRQPRRRRAPRGRSRAAAIACGCRISPRRRAFIVSLSNDRRGAHVDSACVRGVGVMSAVLTVDISNALDLCDSHAWRQSRHGTAAAHLLLSPSGCALALAGAVPLPSDAKLSSIGDLARQWGCCRRPFASLLAERPAYTSFEPKASSTCQASLSWPTPRPRTAHRGTIDGPFSSRSA
jgi:hypothetical protein